MPRFYCPAPLLTGTQLQLPAGAARHVQVLRLQPGDAITLFDGQMDAEYCATVTEMGRSHVQVQVGQCRATQREASRRVHLAVGMPANERMDWLVEKATELGVASIQPLTTERSVLRLSGERAEKKQLHWRSVAVAACEQCGGNRVPLVHPVRPLSAWLTLAATSLAAGSCGLLLSLRAPSQRLKVWADTPELTFLSGPEGGLSPSEEDAALAAGMTPVSLGTRVLRAETAALSALAALLV